MFYNYYKYIPGYFDFQEIFQMGLQNCKENDILVEVGSYFGKSTCYMMELIEHFNKNVQFFTVDPLIIVPNDNNQENGLGTGSPWDEPLAKWAERIGEDALYKAFNWNIACSPGKNRLTGLLRMKSVEAAKKFENESIQFCFLDGGHSYENVINDLNAWWPKMKNNSLIGGHDYFSDVSKAITDFLGKFPSENRPIMQVIKNSWIIQKT